MDEQLIKDAERYRWLKSQDTIAQHDVISIAWRCSSLALAFGVDELDEAIDAAMEDTKYATTKRQSA